MELTPLAICDRANAVLAFIRKLEREHTGGWSVYVPPAHWFITKVRSDGNIAWFMGGEN
jgi:hypothetical protein